MDGSAKSAGTDREEEDMEVDDEAGTGFALGPSSICRVLEFPKFIPMENPYQSDDFYVRDCYVEYYELVLKMLETRQAVALTGTPGKEKYLIRDVIGIGKSVFMAYFFLAYSAEHKEAFITLASYNKESKLKAVVITQGGKVVDEAYTTITTEDALRKHVKDPTEMNNLWLLDGPPDDVSKDYRWVSFSSPNESWMKKVGKNPRTCYKVYMPTWTLAELWDAAAHLKQNALLTTISDDQLRDFELDPANEPVPRRAVIDYCFNVFGGVPRAWFAVSDDVQVKTAFLALRKAAHRLELEEIMKALMGEDVPEQVHRLLHFVPDKSSQQLVTIQVGSATIKRLLMDRENEIMDKGQVHFENILRATPEGMSLLGFFIERRTYRRLCSGCTIDARRLAEEEEEKEEKEKGKKPSLVVTVPEACAIGRITNTFEVKKFERTMPHIVQPASKNLESIDGFYWAADGFVVLFQVTVSLEHPVKARGICKVLMALGIWEKVLVRPETVALVFVVPQVNKSFFRKQKIMTGPLLEDTSPVTAIDNIAGATAKKLADHGVRTVGDLKMHKKIDIGEIKKNAPSVISAALTKLDKHETGGYSGSQVDLVLKKIPQYGHGLIHDAVASSDSDERLHETLRRCESHGAQVVASSAFVAEFHGWIVLGSVEARKHATRQERSATMASELATTTNAASHTDRVMGKPPEETLADADSDRIGGFVWKFPSEGSNTRDPQAPMSVAYPRKCRYCARAWVSSYVNERRHWQHCQPAETESANTASLGVARRVWCEVDAALTGFQWRDDVDAAQDAVACRVAFHEMTDVELLETPRASFQITTKSGRRIVLQCREEPQADDAKKSVVQTRALDARQWAEYLQMFSRFTQQRQALDAICEEPSQDASVVDTRDDPTVEIWSEALRLIEAKDADALEEMLTDADVGPVARALVDDNGSSLLVRAIQLDAGARVVRAVLRAGVDCNAKNNEGESPLLLAAASGDVELLGILLCTPSLHVNQRCALGATAFHAAANAGEVAVLRALCDHGEVATKYVDENGWTALHYAAACKSGREAMQFLCELEPELVDARCIQGNTALHVAAGCGCEPNLRVLLETAANPHLVNSDGHTAYHVALHNHHIACAMVVNEYMETPRETYERAATYDKEDRVAPVETTVAAFGAYNYYPSMDGDFDSPASCAWAEYYTEDQIPYYYNSVTGESTWHIPEPLKEPACVPPPPPPPPLSMIPVTGDAVWSQDDEISDNATEPPNDDHGQRLPLCMIPLVSPLVSLDDPTAATKLDSRRKKDRERRRSRMLRQRSHAALPLPPHEQRRTHHYEVQ